MHRDVNPMNILVDRDGTAKLTDLGLAIDLDDDEEGIVTRDGATVGTFDYISPEQARHSRQVDTRSDLYSLGCTLYHMLCGRVPFPAPSLPEKLFAHQQTNAEPLTKVVPGVPEGLDAVVRRLMSKNAKDRFARPRDVARALEPFASPVGELKAAGIETPPQPIAVRIPEVTVVSNGSAPAPPAPSPAPPAPSPRRRSRSSRRPTRSCPCRRQVTPPLRRPRRRLSWMRARTPTTRSGSTLAPRSRSPRVSPAAGRVTATSPARASG